jgi:hypothetical protein
VAFVREKHGLCQSQLLKFINGLFGARTEGKRSGQVFFRRFPVKFSSTIHGGTKKKKRPMWALFLPFFSLRRICLRRRIQAAGA